MPYTLTSVCWFSHLVCLSCYIPVISPFLPHRKNLSDSKGPGRAFMGVPGRVQASPTPASPRLCRLWGLSSALFEVCTVRLMCSIAVTGTLGLCVQPSRHVKVPPGVERSQNCSLEFIVKNWSVARKEKCSVDFQNICY